jgi:hypothetical protein
MAKKKNPSQPQSSGSSSVNINTFTKGMNKDVAPSFEGQQAWWHARNAANNSEDGDLGMIGNEPSNLSCGVIPYTVIGAIHRYGDEWVVFSTDNVSSEIGRFDDSECKYTTLVNDPCLNFSKKHLIVGAAKENFDCTWEVYWDDANNPSRALNIDDIPWKKIQISGPDIDGSDCVEYEIIEPKSLDCEQIRLAPLLDTPCITLEKSIDGGMLANGAYQVFVGYTENEQRVTDYIGISNIQTLWNHEGTGGSLDINFSNLDLDYDYFELVILRRNQGQTSAKRIGLYSTQVSTINIDFIDESLSAVDLKLIPLRSPAYEKSESMFVVNDWLIRQGPTEQFDFNYQPIANEIKTNWVINSVPSTYYSKGGNRTGLLRDEQYAFFIRWIYNTGERSSSYHIPGRAPEMYNGTMENEIINGNNVLNPTGDPLFKVYNTASITSTAITALPDETKITGRGEMGYWESTELYPSNRPDIWGDLCGKPIRHHKMPDESIGGNTSPLHLTSSNGDEINILGVEFSNIGRPKYNNGSYIENVVGYEILRGSRLGAKSILGKGLFRNMRKYTVPNAENLIGGDVQGLYPNYPYNDLRPDVYFHKGGNNILNRTDGVHSFSESLDDYKALGDGPDINGEPSGYSRKVFTFSSPELMFTKPFLNAYETKIYGQLSGSASGTFQPSEDHPQFKLLRNGAAIISGVIGLGYAIRQVRGTKNVRRNGAAGNMTSQSGTFIGITSGNQPGVAQGAYSIANATANTGQSAISVLLEALLDSATGLADLWIGGATNYATEKIQMALSQAIGNLPGMRGGSEEISWTSDNNFSSIPIFLKIWMSAQTSKANIAAGGNEFLELIYNMQSANSFVLKHNSFGFFSNFSKQTNGLWRIKNSDSNYIGQSFQTFDNGNYKINNLFRPSTVAVSLEKSLTDPDVKDKSRYTIGGSLDVSLSSAGVYQNSNPAPHSNSYFQKYKQARKSNISAYYGALKFNFDNQYGQLDGIKQIPMRSCIQLLDSTLPNQYMYTSDPIFSGDTFIGRYTEKTIMPIFTRFLLGQPDGYTFDYSLYVNIPYPRYWLNSQRFDLTPLAQKFVTLGLGSSNAATALMPNDLFYLDRTSNSTNSSWSSIFNNGSDPNPALSMAFAYIYSHVNGILDFYVESEVNLDQRDWEDEPKKRIYSVYDYNDLNELFHARIEKDDNFYKYDESLSPSRFPTQMSSFGQIQPRDYDPYVAANCFVSYPKRLIYSLQAQEESKRDYWRVFLNNNYKDFKNEVSVIKPINKSGALVFFPYLSPQMFQGLDTLKTQLDTKLTIGDGGLFSQPFQNVANADISNEYGSCESLRGVINTPLGLFFISQQQGKIFQYGGKGLDPISNNGMKWWFAKYLPSRFIKQFPSSENTQWTDNPVAGVGCQVMYDSVDDVVYFMKKDYQLKPDYIGQATFVDRPVRPIEIRGEARVPVSIDIGDPIYFDDCSWTISYDPKSKAWISFHDWHPELALPSINHFFTTKTVETTVPQCPPGYNFNPSTGLCEIGINTTELAEVIVDNRDSIISGGPQACLIDIVIAMDTSGSTGNPQTNGTRAFAQLQWVMSFVNQPEIQNALNGGSMQIGFTSWSGLNQQRSWTTGNGPFISPVSMSDNVNSANVQTWYINNWYGSQTATAAGMNQAIGLAQQTGSSSLAANYPARQNDPSYRRIVITVTDTGNNPGPQCNLQSPTIQTVSNAAPNFQFMYTVFCGVNSPYPGGPGQPQSAALNNIVCQYGQDITITSGTAGSTTSAYIYGIQSDINANYPITNWDVVAQEITSSICGSDFVCECPTGYTLVYPDASNGNVYDQASGTCSDLENERPICRKVTCECPPSTVPGSVLTETGECPDTPPLLYQIGNPDFVQSNPKQCNYFYYDSLQPNYKVGGFWRHNVRCDSFANYYGEDYPWEIDLISNTGQAVNTIRSFEYQLETYVYKGDPQYNMCGGDKWEDLDFNFDASIIYNNDQTSGLLLLNPQPVNSPWTNLDFPSIGFNGIQILVSKVEHKFRFNQFWDVTNDRGEFTNAEQPIFDTSCNGYIRPLNQTNINYGKSQTERKKFRHYSNNVILRRNVSGNRKMLLRLNNTKLLLSQR